MSEDAPTRRLALTLHDLRLAAVRVAVVAAVPALVGWTAAGPGGVLWVLVVLAWVVGPAALVERATLRAGWTPLFAGAAAGLASALFVPAAVVQAVWLLQAGDPAAGAADVARFLQDSVPLLVLLGLLAFVAQGGASFMHGVVAGGVPVPSPRNPLARWLLEPLLATGAVTLGLPLAASNAVAGRLDRLLDRWWPGETLATLDR